MNPRAGVGWAALLIGGAGLAVGCHHTRASAPAFVGSRMVGGEELCPACPPPPKGSLLYQQPPEISVSVKSRKRGDDYVVDLFAHDELFDDERYESTPQVFAVEHAAGEDYNPPIPILRFPLNLGGPSWTWTGTLSSEENPHPAEATITTRDDSVTLGFEVVGTVRVDVDLVIQPYRGAPLAKRRMSFWFEAGHGLIMRDFAGTSVRKPVFR